MKEYKLNCICCKSFSYPSVTFLIISSYLFLSWSTERCFSSSFEMSRSRIICNSTSCSALLATADSSPQSDYPCTKRENYHIPIKQIPNTSKSKKKLKMRKLLLWMRRVIPFFVFCQKGSDFKIKFLKRSLSELILSNLSTGIIPFWSN